VRSVSSGECKGPALKTPRKAAAEPPPATFGTYVSNPFGPLAGENDEDDDDVNREAREGSASPPWPA
jgi:hypothetical protein